MLGSVFAIFATRTSRTDQKRTSNSRIAKPDVGRKMKEDPGWITLLRCFENA